MKLLQHRNTFIAIFLVTIFFPKFLIAQSDTIEKVDTKKMNVKNMLDSQHFIFVAQSVSPLRGGVRNLTSYFDVEVAKNTMLSSLPYFGRAYDVPYGSVNGPLDFTSTKISYSITPAKKSGWNVLIKPKDKTEIQQYLFTIYNNGYGSLYVTSVSRDAISYNGYITSGEKKKGRQK